MEVVASLSQGRTAAAQCGFFTYKSVPVIFEPPCKKLKFLSVIEDLCSKYLFLCLYIEDLQGRYKTSLPILVHSEYGRSDFLN